MSPRATYKEAPKGREGQQPASAEEAHVLAPPLSMFTGIAFFALLAVVVPLMAISGFADSKSMGLTLVLAYVALLYPSMRLARLVALGVARWPTFMFWVFAYLWIGLAGWSQTYSRSNPYTLSFDDATLQMAAVLAIAGMGSCDVGFALASARARRRGTTAREAGARELSKRRTILLSIAVLIAVPLIVGRTGGWQSLLVTRQERSDSMASVGLSMAQSGLYSAGAFAAPLVASVALICLMRRHSDLVKRPAWWLLLSCVVGLALFVNNPISNPRYVAGTVLLALLLALGVGRSGRHFRATAIGVFSVLLFAFPYSDLFRVANTAVTLRPLSFFLVSKGDYDTATQLASAIEFRAATGGTGGSQLLTALLFFVPRSLWSHKGDATGALLAQYQNYRYSNVSSPLWTEGYVDFGLVGVIVLFLALGWGLQRLESSAPISDWTIPGWSSVAVPVLAAYSLLVYRGALLTAVGPLAVLALLPLLLLRRNRGGPE